jgi:hypothetical protein
MNQEVTAERTSPTLENSAIAQVRLPSDAPQAMTVTQAARILATIAREPKEEPPAAPEKEAAAVEPEESEAKADNGAPPDVEAPAETTESAEPADDLPPIEPPRSWKAEEKERFKSLPREMQAYLTERETERDRATRTSQNEAAEKLKALSAKEQAVEQARQQYEAALPQLLASMQQQQAGEFADIKTITDVEKLAREDWPRYLQWDVAQKKIAAVQQEMLSAQQRQVQEKQQKFAEFATRQDDLFKERVPDMGDPAKAAKLQSAAMTALKDLGFEEAELAASWNGEKDISLRDHRLQLLIRDATLWREAQAKAVVAAKKPVPPVQRPGAATVKNAGRESEIQNLSKQLDANPSGRNAALIAAKLVAARRAAR